MLPCMPRHGSVGVTMYVDDSGSFKQLPVNARATDIAQSCGMITTASTLLHVSLSELRSFFVWQQVLGDAFIGRVKENDDEFERLDFLLSDLSSASPWMHTALRHHKEKVMQPVAEELLQKMNYKEQPKITEITPAEDARQEGGRSCTLEKG